MDQENDEKLPEKERLLKKIAKAETHFAEAKRQVALAKRKVLDTETVMIEAKMELDRLRESLRVNRNTVPSSNTEITQREQDIAEFRNNHPELVAWAKDRDDRRGQDKEEDKK